MLIRIVRFWRSAKLVEIYAVKLRHYRPPGRLAQPVAITYTARAHVGP
jgi:hypothetical protein